MCLRPYRPYTWKQNKEALVESFGSPNYICFNYEELTPTIYLSASGRARLDMVRFPSRCDRRFQSSHQRTRPLEPPLTLPLVPFSCLSRTTFSQLRAGVPGYLKREIGTVAVSSSAKGHYTQRSAVDWYCSNKKHSVRGRGGSLRRRIQGEDE